MLTAAASKTYILHRKFRPSCMYVATNASWVAYQASGILAQIAYQASGTRFNDHGGVIRLRLVYINYNLDAARINSSKRVS